MCLSISEKQKSEIVLTDACQGHELTRWSAMLPETEENFTNRARAEIMKAV